MESMAEFFHMGGYAVFVWPAYGLTAVVLAGMLAASLRDLKARQAALDALTESSDQGDGR
jgi:heme exporter protein D